MQLLKNFFKTILNFFKMIFFVLTIIAIPFAIFAITKYWGMILSNFFNELSEEQMEIIYKFACIISPFMFIAAPAVLWGLYFKSRKRKKEIIRKSEENNTFVTAHLVKSEFTYIYDDDHNYDHKVFNYEGIYEYTVNGETKERRICFYGLPPNEIRLYPQNGNSSKFISNAGHEEKTWFAVPLLCFATIILWIWISIPLYILSDYLQ